MREILIAAILLTVAATPAAAQTFPLGTPSDPCTQAPGDTGGPLTIANTSNTVRYGNFTCTFPVGPDGLFTVELDFLEPCYQLGACSAGQVTKAGQRIQNVFANDMPILWNFDPFAAGATDVMPARRTALVFSAGGKIAIRVQTVVRSAVLAGVVVSLRRMYFYDESTGI